MSDRKFVLPEGTRAACASVLGALLAWAWPAVALADNYMTGISGEIDSTTYEMKSGSGHFANAMTDIVFDITTKFMLPVAIVIVVSKAVYIAVFGIMAAADPLHLIQKKSTNDFESVSPEEAKRAFATEIRKTAKALIVVLGLWTFINAVARIVMYLFAIMGA